MNLLNWFKMQTKRRTENNVTFATNTEKADVSENTCTVKYGRIIFPIKKQNKQEIIIRKLYMPSHAGEFEYGYSLVFIENKWQFELSYIAAIGSTEYGYSYFDLPNDIWYSPPYEALNKFVIQVAKFDPHIRGREFCKEWEKIERLFEEMKQNGMMPK